MKKILALLVCLLTISTGVRADDDRPVRFDQLPAKAQAYVKKYFPQEKVALAKMEKDFFHKNNGSKYSGAAVGTILKSKNPTQCRILALKQRLFFIFNLNYKSLIMN